MAAIGLVSRCSASQIHRLTKFANSLVRLCRSRFNAIPSYRNEPMFGVQIYAVKWAFLMGVCANMMSACTMLRWTCVPTTSQLHCRSVPPATAAP